MSDTDDATPARPRKWVKWQHLANDTWLIQCVLCGKLSTRGFSPERNDDPKRSASDYVGEHLASPEHAAAITAYKAPAEPRTPTGEEELLRKIFGTSATQQRSPEQMRRSAARRAAESFLRGRR